MVLDVIKNCDLFFVENIRTARRFISSLKLGIEIEQLHFEQLDKNTSWEELYNLFEPVRNGSDAGIISEAGLPCLADPGNIAVSFAHDTKIKVIPLPGSSSIQLALIGSGFNGQQFTFHGYLPIEKKERIKKIKELEKFCSKGYTQVFMETPYRNQSLLKDILSNCSPNLLLSIASDVSGSRELIQTMTIKKWRESPIDIHKLPSIFSFGQFSK